jgi:hypothetical protein
MKKGKATASNKENKKKKSMKNRMGLLMTKIGNVKTQISERTRYSHVFSLMYSFLLTFSKFLMKDVLVQSSYL